MRGGSALAVVLALLLLAGCVGAAGPTMSRAFELERRGNYAGGGSCLSQRARAASRPIVAALLGLERVLVPLDRPPTFCRRCAPRSPPSRPRQRAAPCTAWRCEPGRPPISRTACARSPSGGPRQRQATRRRTASGARPRSASETAPAPGEAYLRGRERLRPARRAGGGDGPAGDRRRRLPQRAARVAAGDPARPRVPRDRGRHAGPGARLEHVRRFCPTSAGERDFRPDGSRRTSCPLGRSARRHSSRLQDGLPPIGPRRWRRCGGCVDQLRTSPAETGARRRARRSSSLPSGAREQDRARIRLDARPRIHRGRRARGRAPNAGRAWPTIERPRAPSPPGRPSTLVQVLIGEGKLDEAGRRLAEHRTRHERRRVRDAPAPARRGICPGRRPGAGRFGAGRRQHGGGLALAGRIRLYQGDIAGAIERFKAAGPYAGDRAEATERTVLLALLQPIEADSLPALGAALLAARARVTRAGGRGSGAGSARRAAAAKGGAEVAPSRRPTRGRDRQGRRRGAPVARRRGADGARPPPRPRSWPWRELLLDQRAAERGGRAAGAPDPDLSRERAGPPGPPQARPGARRGAPDMRAARIPGPDRRRARWRCLPRLAGAFRWVAAAPWLLVPMDDAQTDHLKAYGLAYPAARAGRSSGVVPQLPERVVPAAG